MSNSVGKVTGKRKKQGRGILSLTVCHCAVHREIVNHRRLQSMTLAPDLVTVSAQSVSYSLSQ